MGSVQSSKIIQDDIKLCKSELFKIKCIQQDFDNLTLNA